MSISSIVSSVGIGGKLTFSLVKDFGEAIFYSLELENNSISGRDIIVEIDEAKFGKRKCHRRHAFEGVWVLGGRKQKCQSSYKADLRACKRRGCYNMLDQSGYDHLTVKHSQNFKDPITGVHTNTIEGTWNALKIQVKPRNRTKDSIDGQLWEFI